ncbi:MAG TPA: Asp-tRNA(Asn)/Glu-tRNA(Gln) amidotransferase subunit GatC [Candidatus Scybalousia intestinigallinarum]|jgi:aspartyl-tRNA(Asn)/glutamyl-tRNA(Gln) amidotransferase subunit C|nr:Asp-tRNA(Asn)/Glu-tRNA(Gln) amidotransferase subunit GatC [Candidatus Scybalousia intestinigallinarum]
MNKLSKEEVLHVAHLARIKVTDEELEKYQIDLKKLLDDVDKINDIEVESEELLVTPVEQDSVLRSDQETSSVSFEEIKKNVPAVTGNFVEVPVMIGE